MTKRVRKFGPAKPGEIKVGWGRADNYDAPDICSAWGGQGADKSDARMVNTRLTEKRMRQSFPDMKVVFEPSFIEELEARGYDITTLKFSIQKLMVHHKEG